MNEQENIEKIETFNGLIMKETDKAILVDPLNFRREESIWIPKSQFLVESLEIKPWRLKKLGFEPEAPLKLQLPEGGWPAVERKHPRVEKEEEEAEPEAIREILKNPRDGATVHDDNPINEQLKDRDGEGHAMTLNEKLTEIKIGEGHAMTLNEKLTEIKIEAIEDGIDAIVQLKLRKYVKTLALIWNYVRADKTFKNVTEIQRGYAVSAIFREHNKEEHEHEHKQLPQDDDANVVKVYRIPNMGGGIYESDDNNEEGAESLPETD
jgi:hypothetical protein